ncbi:MAG: molybdopterin-binding protein [Candidatus Heimdallarchaeota archaeon]
MITVEIICFGNELLIGKTINTNANWLGKRLTMLGAELQRIITIGDVIEDMAGVVKEALQRKPDVIITTGGLGPTFDDMALAAIAQALNRELELNEQAVEFIKERLTILRKERGLDFELTKERLGMAMVPKDASVLRNRAGSAPGVVVKENDTLIFSVPGVPSEMKSIFDHEITKYFNLDPDVQFYERSIKVNHIPESELANAISEIREKFPTIYIKTHPHSSKASAEGMIEVEIHITSLCSEEESVKLKEAQEDIVKIIKTMKGTSDKKPKITLQIND